MSEVVAVGLPLVGLGIWLKTMPNRAHLWFRLAAWAEANGEAAVLRQRLRPELLRNAAERSKQDASA